MDEKEIRKIGVYKNIGIKNAAYLHNREKLTPGGISYLLHRPLPQKNPLQNLETPHFDFSNFPALEDVTLDSMDHIQNQKFPNKHYSSVLNKYTSPTYRSYTPSSSPLPPQKITNQSPPQPSQSFSYLYTREPIHSGNGILLQD